MKAYRKTTFHKLYLIEPELYNKVLPLLNQLEKNELIQLNEKHSEEEIIPNNKENNELKSSFLKNETMLNNDSNTSPQTNLDPQIQENAMSNNEIISDDTSRYSTEKYPISVKSSNRQKRPKKFQCLNCTKAFTTKFSLKRHNENFHAIQSNEILQNHDSNESDLNITLENNRGMKRKLINTVNQSQNKRLKPTKGIKRPLEEDLETDATDFKQPRLETSVMGEVDYSAPKGIKREMKRVADSLPRKKIRWIDFY